MGLGTRTLQLLTVANVITPRPGILETIDSLEALTALWKPSSHLGLQCVFGSLMDFIRLHPQFPSFCSFYPTCPCPGCYAELSSSSSLASYMQLLSCCISAIMAALSPVTVFMTLYCSTDYYFLHVTSPVRPKVEEKRSFTSRSFLLCLILCTKGGRQLRRMPLSVLSQTACL